MFTVPKISLKQRFNKSRRAVINQAGNLRKCFKYRKLKSAWKKKAVTSLSQLIAKVFHSPARKSCKNCLLRATLKTHIRKLHSTQTGNCCRATCCYLMFACFNCRGVDSERICIKEFGEWFRKFKNYVPNHIRLAAEFMTAFLPDFSHETFSTARQGISNHISWFFFRSRWNLKHAISTVRKKWIWIDREIRFMRRWIAFEQNIFHCRQFSNFHISPAVLMNKDYCALPLD